MSTRTTYDFAIPILTRIIDFILICVSGYLAIHIRFYDQIFSNHFYYLLIGVEALIFVAISNRLYYSWRGRSVYQFVFLILGYWVLSQAILFSIIFFSQSGILFSRLWLTLWSIITVLLLSSSRFLIYSILKKVRFKGINLKHVAIVGEGYLRNNLIQKINQRFDSGFKVIKVLDFNNYEEISNLANLELNEIWITYDLNYGERVHLALEALSNSPATIRIAPDLYTYRLINHSITDILGFPMFDVTSTRLVGINAFLKDSLDKSICFIALLLLSPLMILLALGIKLTSPGPIFYRQERVSLNGKIFNMLKFRSMPVDVENEKIVWGNADKKVNHWFGNFLRKSNFDELPQLINILKGDMSIVGPRPERPMFVNEFKNQIPNYMKKHLVKGGMTGWAQVNGLRGDTDLNERIEYDLFYIENWSFWFDLKIILLTIFIPFGFKNNFSTTNKR